MTSGGAVAGWPASPLWDAAVAIYARPEAAAACLRLQDEHDADVLLLLLACWLGRRGAVLSDETAGRCRAVAGDWAGLIQPLRDVRRRLKERLPAADEAIRTPLTATRERVREAELALERAALLALERETACLRPATEPDPAAAANALRRLVTLEPATRSELLVLLSAAWPGLSREELEGAAGDAVAAPAEPRHPDRSRGSGPT